MGKLLIVIFIIAIIFFIISQKNKALGNFNKSKTYKTLIIIIVVGGLLFLLATSGRYIFPQLIQIIKMTLPILTKFIGI